MALCRMGHFYLVLSLEANILLGALCFTNTISLRKHAYSNILKIVQPKTGKFPDKNYDIFLISAQNIDCRYSLELPRRGGSNEYPQSMFF